MTCRQCIVSSDSELFSCCSCLAWVLWGGGPAYSIDVIACLVLFVSFRVATCLENLEMSGDLKHVREMSGILLMIREMNEKIVLIEKCPK